MLKEILSISGKSGLFKMISQGKNMIIVQSLQDGKRIPAYSKDRIISLEDIAIFTQTDEKPLSEVLSAIKTKEKGEQCNIEPKADKAVYKAYMAEILPDYDQERVYHNDIKKIITWYNTLIQAGITDFTPTAKPSESKGENKPVENKEKQKYQTTKSKPQAANKTAHTKTITNRKMGG